MLYTNDAIRRRVNRDTKVKCFFNLIIYLILIPLLVYNITLIVKTFLNPEETSSFFGIKTYVIVSGSMQPEIDIGDIVVIKDVDKEDLHVGDVISYKKQKEGTVITHRIISMDTDENGEIAIVTKGDNNNTEDSGTIGLDDVEGKLIKIIPKVGNIMLSMQNKYFITIALLLFYTYVVESRSLQRRRLERRRKRIEYEERLMQSQGV